MGDYHACHYATNGMMMGIGIMMGGAGGSMVKIKPPTLYARALDGGIVLRRLIT